MLVELVHQKNCKKNNVITDYHTGEIACNNCGAVSSERSIDVGPETLGFGSDGYQNKSRVGGKTSLKMADMGLSTIIESKNKDAAGKILSNENQRMFYRLRMWDKNSRSANYGKSLPKGFLLLDAISAKLGLPESVIEQTAHLFRKILAKKISSGRAISDTLCAATYISCRLSNTPRTIQDIADAANIKKKNLQKVYRFIARELDIYPKIYDPTEFVTRISNAVHISEKTERHAFRILNLASKRMVSTSKNPMAMAAAAIHLASKLNNEKISQLKISDASGISAVTIRNRSNEIMNEIGDEINA